MKRKPETDFLYRQIFYEISSYLLIYWTQYVNVQIAKPIRMNGKCTCKEFICFFFFSNRKPFFSLHYISLNYDYCSLCSFIANNLCNCTHFTVSLLLYLSLFPSFIGNLNTDRTKNFVDIKWSLKKEWKAANCNHKSETTLFRIIIEIQVKVLPIIFPLLFLFHLNYTNVYCKYQIIQMRWQFDVNFLFYFDELKLHKEKLKIFVSLQMKVSYISATVKWNNIKYNTKKCSLKKSWQSFE